MRTAKITSLSGTLVYGFFAIKPAFNLQPFAQILQSFNQNIHPIMMTMIWVAIIGCLLNLGFFLYLMRQEAKDVELPKATVIGVLLLFVPLVVSYILFAITASKIYYIS
jgi:heme/copper-type cytochrome/quinol oxidase subunit 4